VQLDATPVPSASITPFIPPMVTRTGSPWRTSSASSTAGALPHLASQLNTLTLPVGPPRKSDQQGRVHKNSCVRPGIPTREHVMRPDAAAQDADHSMSRAPWSVKPNRGCGRTSEMIAETIPNAVQSQDVDPPMPKNQKVLETAPVAAAAASKRGVPEMTVEQQHRHRPPTPASR